MTRKNFIRLVFFASLAFFAWTCNVSNSGGDTILTLTVGDSLKATAGKYDSIQIKAVVVNGTDTTNQKVVFHDAYKDSSQLQNLNLGHLPSNNFTIVLTGYRHDSLAIMLELPFTNGKAGAPKLDTLIVPDTAHTQNHKPLMWLALPDSGSTSFQINEGATLALHVMAKDSNAQDSARLLHLQNPLPSACGNPSYDTTSGAFSFKPAFACVDSGGDSVSATFNFVTEDQSHPPLYDTLDIQVTVLDSNSAPKWKADSASLAGKQGKVMSLRLDSLYLGDAEGDSVSFAASLGSISQNPLTWSFTPSFSDSGAKTVTITSTDSHKPPASSHLTLQLSIADSVRVLKVVINSPANGYVTRDSIVIVRWSVNGAAQTSDTTEHFSKEGQNGITRTYHDTLTNNAASDSITVTWDKTPPNKPSVTAPGLTKNQKPTWTWKSGGSGGCGYYRFKLDTAIFSDTVGKADSSFTPASNLSQGRHVLYIEERDVAGNWSAPDSSGIARIDITPPEIVIISPPDSLVTNQSSVQVQWSVDGVVQAAGTKSLNEGVNVIADSATDSAGNSSSMSITVTRRSNVLFVNAAAIAGGDGNSWTSAYKYLQTALGRAQSGQELWVAKGIYKPAAGRSDSDTFDTSFVMKTGVNMYGGFSGKEDDRTLRDWVSNETSLSGERGNPNDSTDNLGIIVFGADNATLDGFVLEKAYTAGYEYNAAMQNAFVSPQVFNCTFRDNNNVQQQYGGGAMLNSGSNANIQNCIFLRNSSQTYATVVLSGGAPTLSNCIFEDNTGPSGALDIEDGTPVIMSCQFISNHPSSTGGVGGVRINSGNTTILNTLFSGNAGNLGSSGGAISFTGSVNLTLENCVFTSNSASTGGAIYGSASTLNMSNCTFMNNSSMNNSGGDLYLNSPTGSAMQATVKNSIFWGSDIYRIVVASDTASVPEGIDSLSISYSDITGGTNSIQKIGAGVIQSMAGNIVDNPLFKNSASPTGLDGKYFTSDDGLNLFAHSPCINSGDTNTADLPATDITGARRVQSGRVDMGAYEQ